MLLFLHLIINYANGNDNFRFYKAKINDELPQNTIDRFFQDSKGFIWLSTYDGLCRYDGNKIKTFYARENDNRTINNNAIYSIAEGCDNKLYFASGGGGLNVYNQDTELFEYYYSDSTRNSIVDNAVYGLVSASDSTIWIATYNGVSRFFPLTNCFISYPVNDSNMNGYPDATALCVHEDFKKNIWIGTYEEGILKYDKKTDSFIQFKNNAYRGDIFESNIINQITSYNDTTLILATKTGAYYFNTITGNFIAINKYTKEIKVVLVDFQENVWMVSGEDGIFVKDFSGKEIHLMHNEMNPYSLPDNKASSIYQDRDGLIWIGTVSKGLINYFPVTQQFKHFYKNNNSNSLIGNEIYGLAEDHHKNLWITTTYGVSILDRKTGKFKNIVEDGTNKSISSNLVWDAKYDTDGYMWLALSNGVNRYDFKTGLFKHYKRKVGDTNSIANKHVFCIEKDKNGYIWVGTSHGLSKYNEQTDTWKSYYSNENDTNSLSNNIIWNVFSDSKGNLWIGTNKGLNQFNFSADNFIRLNITDSVQDLLASSEINSFLEDKEGLIWISTYRGILRFDPITKQLEQFNVDNGLPNDMIYGIQEHNDHLWFTSNKGLTKFNKHTYEILNFDVKDGIQGDEFNMPSIKLHDGLLAFGGMNGLTVFNPDEVSAPEKDISIYFTSLMLNGEPVLPLQERFGEIPLKHSILKADTIELSYQEKLISLDFTALLYFQNNKINYRYRVLPKTKKWIELNGTNNVTFTNLPPGKYTLEIQSTNEQKQWLNNTKSLVILIHPPFYKRVWFYILIALLIVLYIRGKIKRYKNANDRLERAVLDRTEEISAQKKELENQRDRIAKQKTKIERFADELELKVEKKTIQYKEAKERAEESDRLKSAFLANMSHEIRTPMNAIIGFSDLLANIDVSEIERKNYANFIRNNGDALLNLLNDILDASIIESGKLLLVNKEFELIDALDNLHMSFLYSQLLKDKPNVKLDIEPCKYTGAKLNTDLFRLNQVLNNLVGNALKYTNTGSVSISVVVEDSIAIFAVRDTGVGIKDEELSRIFDRFHKDEEGDKKTYRGGGLGLPISKSLVELMGGKIWVESEINVGSAFFFSIPGVIK